MPRGKKTTSKKRTTSKRKFATPIKSVARKAAPKKAVSKKAVQTRTSAKSIVMEKFEGLEKDIAVLRTSIDQLLAVQRAAMLDNYRNYFINTQGSVTSFSFLVGNNLSALGLTEADLEKGVADLKEDAPATEKAPTEDTPALPLEATHQPGVNVELNNRHEHSSPEDLMNVL